MTHEIGFLLFPDAQQLDLTGPYEMLASLPGTRMHLVAATLDAVRTSTGLVLQPTTTYADCLPLDVVCVPGGKGIDALLTDTAAIDFLKRQAAGARYVTSVCTGALLLGAAGLLKGKRATTHWSVHDLLAKYGATPVRERVVRDGNLLTGGGVTAGIDFGLSLAAELAGRAEAEAVQLFLEYAPAPPFSAGDPEIAPTEVLAAVKAKGADRRRQREALVEQTSRGLRNQS